MAKWEFKDPNIGKTFRCVQKIEVISKTDNGYEVRDADEPDGTWIISSHGFNSRYKEIK